MQTKQNNVLLHRSSVHKQPDRLGYFFIANFRELVKILWLGRIPILKDIIEDDEDFAEITEAQRERVQVVADTEYRKENNILKENKINFMDFWCSSWLRKEKRQVRNCYEVWPIRIMENNYYDS